MALKEWKKSASDDLWFYKVDDTETYNWKTHPAKETLNAVKSGTSYDIYHTMGSLGNWKKVKRVSNRQMALRCMKSYMRKH
jgi:hypothetical protein